MSFLRNRLLRRTEFVVFGLRRTTRLWLGHPILRLRRISVLFHGSSLLFIHPRLRLERRLHPVISVGAVPGAWLPKRPKAFLVRLWSSRLIYRSWPRWCHRPDECLFVQMSASLRLPLVNGTHRRGWRSHRHHRAADHGCRWSNGSRTSGTDHTRPYRLCSNCPRHRGSHYFSRLDPHDVLRHWPSVDERVMRHHRYAIRDMLVHVRNVVDRRALVDDHCVVHIRDSRDVHRRVRDVHVVHIRAADAIPRHVHFSRCQGEPSHANASREAEARAAADKRHQSRRPHRTHHNRSRHPEPSAAYRRPSSVVERRESPRLVFHPGPAPGPNVDPVSEAVRSPSHNHGARMPAWAVPRDVAPIAVFI